MACPTDDNSGLLQITGPIQETTLNNISSNRAPIQISISARTTVPSLLGNQIDDLTGNTCSYKGKTYRLMSIQICAVAHTGYQLPRHTTSPQAELILSFAPASVGNLEDVSFHGILLCFPIYDSSVSSHGSYLEQIIEQPTDTTKIATLQSLFQSTDDSPQVSFGYTTCFETVDAKNQMTSHGLYVIVFPKGIELRSSILQRILGRVGTLKAYRVPTAIRGTDPTLYTYTIANGTKVKVAVSSEGYMYKTSMASTSADFTNRFEYFKVSPTSVSKGAKKVYKTTQYKCVPFDQLRDVKPPNDIKNSYVVPGGKDLSDVLGIQQETANAQKKGDIVSTDLSTDQIETIIGATVGAIVVGMLAVYFSSRLSSNRS